MALHVTDTGRNVYFEHHRGAKTPVILIHGWAMSSDVWTDLIEFLVDAGHGVLAVDQRGCGRSDRDFADMSVAALAQDVADIAAAIGLEPAVINGWSLGGAIAAEAARCLGDHAAGLVLTCGASPRFTRTADFPHGGERENLLAMPGAIRANRAAFFRGLADSVCAVDVGPDARNWMWDIFMRSGPNVIASLTDIADLDQRDLLATLDMPLLSFVGGSDTIIDPEIGRLAAGYARNGQVVELAECGHAPFLEAPAEYGNALLAFLSQTVGRGL